MEITVTINGADHTHDVEPRMLLVDFIRTEAALTGSLGRLFAVAEAYPDLKANQTMMQLSEELTATENKLAFTRQAYNDSVLGYNNACEVFPNNLMAGLFGFRPAEMLQVAEPADREAPKVSFAK